MRMATFKPLLSDDDAIFRTRKPDLSAYAPRKRVPVPKPASVRKPVGIQDLPDKLLCKIASYIPFEVLDVPISEGEKSAGLGCEMRERWRNITAARLLSRCFAITRSEALRQSPTRLYLPGLEKSVEQFYDICSHPVLSLGVEEIVLHRACYPEQPNLSRTVHKTIPKERQVEGKDEEKPKTLQEAIDSLLQLRRLRIMTPTNFYKAPGFNRLRSLSLENLYEYLSRNCWCCHASCVISMLIITIDESQRKDLFLDIGGFYCGGFQCDLQNFYSRCRPPRRYEYRSLFARFQGLCLPYEYEPDSPESWEPEPQYPANEMIFGAMEAINLTHMEVDFDSLHGPFRLGWAPARDPARFFERGFWPKLCTLKLKNCALNVGFALSFFSRHKYTLKHLDLESVLLVSLGLTLAQHCSLDNDVDWANLLHCLRDDFHWQHFHIHTIEWPRGLDDVMKLKTEGAFRDEHPNDLERYVLGELPCPCDDCTDDNATEYDGFDWDDAGLGADIGSTLDYQALSGISSGQTSHHEIAWEDFMGRFGAGFDLQ